jgi:ubiquinone/menaquinone biosynthesis C-methylase UbiE
MQRETFLESAGDQYYERNRRTVENVAHVTIDALRPLGVKPKKVLEIGCSAGHRLEELQRQYGAECWGIDPSKKAVDAGIARNPSLHLTVGTADRLAFEDKAFDFVIFGHCLCLCDPEDFFRIAAEADRVLQDGGFLVIAEFVVPSPYKNPFRHNPGVYAYKMDFTKMFLWHPGYRMISRTYWEHAHPFSFAVDEAVGFDLLIKDRASAFPDNPVKRND